MQGKTTTLLLVVTAGFLSFSSFAQKETNTKFPRNEISVAYGIGTLQEIATTFGDVFAGAISGQTIVNTKGTGAFIASYNRFFSEKVSFGITGVWERITTTYGNPSDKYDWTVFAVMLNGKYYYIANPTFCLYSGLAAGYGSFKSQSSTNSDTNGAFAFQLNLVGARYGNIVGVFSEFGFGYEGIIKLGVSIKF